LAFGIDGRCNDSYYGFENTPECKFDGGDCILWNKYPDCNGNAYKFAGE
jgi:hypothetical protein